jgi:hypothetical protein
MLESSSRSERTIADKYAQAVVVNLILAPVVVSGALMAIRV